MKKSIIFILLLMAVIPSAFGQKSFEKRPDTYNYRRALEELNSENYKTAMELFDAELNDNPKNGWALGWESYINAKFENYGLALEQADKAIKLIPKKDNEFLASIYSIKSDIYLNLEDTAQAINSIEMAIKTNPLSISYLMDHCNIVYNKQDFQAAEADVQKMLKINPNNAAIYVYDGRNKDAQGLFNQAIDCYSQAIKLDGEYSSGYSFRAETYMKLKKYSEAAEDIVKALSIDKDNKAFALLDSISVKSFANISAKLLVQKKKEPNVYYWAYCLGQICSSSERYCDAITYFEEAVKNCDYPSLVYRRIAENYCSINKYAASIEFCTKALEADSTAEIPLHLRAMNYVYTKQYQKAITDINVLINAHPDYDTLYRLRGWMRMIMGQYRNALDDINTAIELDQDQISYHQDRANCYYLMRKYDDAKSEYVAIITLLNDGDHIINEEVLLNSKAWLYKLGNSNISLKKEILGICDRLYGNTADKDDLYNSSCIYSILGEEELMLKCLQASFEAGFNDYNHLNYDFDFYDYRQNEKFISLVSKNHVEFESKYNCNYEEVDQSTEYESITTEVPFTKENGIYKVKCTINDLPLNFYFDTGASNVTLSNVEAAFMIKNGYLSSKDIVGSQYYTTASGDISDGTVINLTSVKFAGLELSSVKASVVHSQNAPLLLGQTVLSRLGKIEIDYEHNVLKITTKRKK